LNKKSIAFMKNFSYTLSSNLVSMIISTIVILVVPKLIGIEDYGYWQLYLFYSSYVGFLHFGWNDGIYLRYGGKEYKELDKDLFFSQFWMLFIFQVLIGVVIISFSTIIFENVSRLFIINMTTLCMLIINVRLMLIYILQCTNRIKEYAQITIMEKVLYCCMILVLLIAGIRKYEVLIIADIIGKLITLFYSAYCCREIVFNKISAFHLNVREIIQNFIVWIKLMFANIASMFIIGIVRFGIERTWDVTTFGKVSLTLSISSLMMIFINAVGVIIFPVLKRANKDKLAFIYSTIRTFLMIPMLGLLAAYYPIKVILSAWLPQYNESVMFMALLFPMCVYEGKMSLLINTYLKTLRKEKLMLTINVVSVLLSIIITILFTIVFENLSLIIVSIVGLLAFRCGLAEMLLSKILNVSVYKDIFLEMIISLIFILTSWFIDSWIGVALYLITYGVYLFYKRKDIKGAMINLKQLVKV
jgi:O-antigen/teichoic acid export membrane protein